MATLVSLEKARSFAKLANVDIGLLQTLLEAAGAAAERLCKRRFASATYTGEKHSGDNDPILILDQFPVVSLTTIVITDASGEDWTYGAATDPTLTAVFDFNADTGEVWFKPSTSSQLSKWLRGRRNIAVTYVAGWDPVPNDVQLAIVHMVEHLVEQEESELGLKSERLGDYARTFQSVTIDTLRAEWPGQVVSILGRYTDWSAGVEFAD